MSEILDSYARLDAERADALDQDDAMEAARIQADLDYLAGQKRRDATRIALLHELELREFQTSRKDVLL